jgi:hypothetical protein
MNRLSITDKGYTIIDELIIKDPNLKILNTSL